MALEFGEAPRKLQRFVESIKWDENRVSDECQRIVARQHAYPKAVGCLDESGTAKSGSETVGTTRQWLGSRGKVDNGFVGVHISYVAPGFQCLLDSEPYLPREWADDPERRKKTTFPMRSNSVRSRRSVWNSSIVRWPMASAWRPGRLTKPTGETGRFSTAWKSASRCLWGKYQRIFTVG